VEIVQRLLDMFAKAAKSKDTELIQQFNACYEDIQRSVSADHGRLPTNREAFEMVADALDSEEVVVIPVNSDTDVAALLDDKAELKLRTPFNVFVGGNILDRGITIPSMVGFYYGRNPRRMQADTVLQHSRMYGARDRRDLAVTRFYSSRPVYDRLRRIDEFEIALREAFEKGAHDRGVAFICRDESNEVIPCAPNKLMLSDVIAVRPGGRLLPVGFQSRAKTHIQSMIDGIDDLIRFLVHTRSLAGAADRSGGELRVGRRQTAQRVVGSEQPVYSALYLTRRMATRRPWAVPRSRR
jgi:hypothetical protein